MKKIGLVVGDVVLLSAIKLALSKITDLSICMIRREVVTKENIAQLAGVLKANSLDILVIESGLIKEVLLYEMFRNTIVLIGSSPITQYNVVNVQYEGGVLSEINKTAKAVERYLIGTGINWSPDVIVGKMKEKEYYKKSYEDEILKQNNSNLLSIAMIPVQEKMKLVNRVRVIAIGSSIGGTTVIEEILEGLDIVGVDLPPIVITQHMSRGFTKRMIKRMSETIKNIVVLEAENGIELKRNSVYFAVDGKHLTFTGYLGKIYVKNAKVNEDINGHLPSIEAMYSSIDSLVEGKNILSIILTGMGVDGVDGMGNLHAHGSSTNAQSRDSCVVFGIAGECVKKGFIDNELTIKEIIKKIHSVY